MTTPHAHIAYESVTAYHADYDAIGSTMLRDFVMDRPKYHGYYVAKTHDPPLPKDKIDRGSLAHRLALEPHKKTKGFAVIPSEHLNKVGGEHSPTGAWGAKAKEFAAANPETQWLKRKDWEHAVEMSLSIHASFIGKWIASGGISEAMFASKHESGLTFRGMIDWHKELPDKVVAFDLKCLTDPTPYGFRQASNKRRYHLQDEHYTRLLREHYGKPVEFHFVCIRNEWPYVCYANKYKSSARYRIEGQWNTAMNDLAECYQSGDWSDPASHQIAEIEPAEYALA